MQSFEQVWERVTETKNSETISTELPPLLQHVYEKIIKQPPDLQEIKNSLENLLTFLGSESGCTSANCVATDLFFALEDWGIDWISFPEPLTDILGDIGGALHDTVSNPEIARSFESLPEQLLERVKKWNPE